LVSVVNPSIVKEFDLIGYNSVNARNQVFDGYFQSTSKVFPRLIKGDLANNYPQWSGYPHLLELAPDEPHGTYYHSAGLDMFPVVAGLTVSVQTEVNYAFNYSDTRTGGLGDGVEMYLYMTPVGTANDTLKYYATGDQNGTFMPSQGSVIFPYSTTPYIEVQWDPAYQCDPVFGGCSPLSGPQPGDFNVYVVKPGSGGTVIRTNIANLTKDYGSGPTSLPQPGDPLYFTVNYSVETSLLEGALIDLNTTSTAYSFTANLSNSLSFSPAYSPSGSYYFGVGGSGNYPTAWGLLAMSANVTGVPSGDVGVLLSSSPSPCGAWAGTSAAPFEFASTGATVAVPNGTAAYFEANTTCYQLTWNATAGAYSGVPLTFVKWSLSGKAVAVSGQSMQNSEIEVTVSGTAETSALYSNSGRPSVRLGWLGYAGNLSIYPTKDPEPFSAQAEFTAGVQTVTTGPPSAITRFTNNTIGIETAPAYEYNASTGEFNLWTVTSVLSSENTPCNYATYGDGYGGLGDSIPGTPGVYECYPVAFVNANQTLSSFPSNAFTNITEQFGNNVSTCPPNGNYNDTYATNCAGVLPQMPFTWRVTLGQAIEAGVDDSYLLASLFIPTDMPGLLSSDLREFTEETSSTAAMYMWNTGNVLNKLDGEFQLFDVAGPQAITESCLWDPVDCAWGLFQTGVLNNLPGWLPQTFLKSQLTPWNGIGLTSVTNRTGNGVVNDWVNTSVNQADPPGTGDNPWYNGVTNRTLWNCLYNPYLPSNLEPIAYCGNDTFTSGTVMETEIPGADLPTLKPASLSIAASNLMWEWWGYYTSTGGEYDNFAQACLGGSQVQQIGIPCEYTGATPPAPLQYSVKPAVSLGGTVTSSIDIPVAGATVTLNQTYNGMSTLYTVPTNATGSWHFFAEPGATYTYTVAPAGGLPTRFMTIPASYTSVANTGTKAQVNLTSLPTATVRFLAGFAAEPNGGAGGSDTLDFAVPAGYGHGIFVWADGDTAYPKVTVPTGMTTEEKFASSAGLAYGTLPAGSYSASINQNSGTTTALSMAVYGVLNDTAYYYQFKDANQSTSLGFTGGAAMYLGILMTGGGYPVTNPSLTTISEETPSTRGGETDLIGCQNSGTLSFQVSPSAVTYGIAAVGIYAGLTIHPLQHLAVTPNGHGSSQTLSFTVPSGLTHELLMWTLSDSVPPTVQIPNGLTNLSQPFGNSTGIAWGTLAAGNYSVKVNYNGGWVNTLTMVVYGVANDSNFTLTKAFEPQKTSWTLAAGDLVYLGVLENGGAVNETNPSLLRIDAETPSQVGGETDFIGAQLSDAFYFSTKAVSYGIAAVGFDP
jgi:hypothetical protein